MFTAFKMYNEPLCYYCIYAAYLKIFTLYFSVKLFFFIFFCYNIEFNPKVKVLFFCRGTWTKLANCIVGPGGLLAKLWLALTGQTLSARKIQSPARVRTFNASLYGLGWPELVELLIIFGQVGQDRSLIGLIYVGRPSPKVGRTCQP